MIHPHKSRPASVLVLLLLPGLVPFLTLGQRRGPERHDPYVGGGSDRAPITRPSMARGIDLADLGRPALSVYADEDGLAHTAITAMAFDLQGYLWVGTEDGAACYNGRTWRQVDMPNRIRSNRVQALLASTDGSLWFGTLGGGLAHRANSQWTIYDTNSTAGGLPDNDVLSLLETVAEDGTRTLWVGTAGGGLARFEHGEWTRFDEQTGLPDDEVWALLETVGDEGTRALWVGTDGGLARLEHGEWTTFDESSGLPDNYVQCLLQTVGEDGFGKLWVGTKGGLARLERNGWTVDGAGPPAGLPSDDVRSLLETVDDQGVSTLWVGTHDGLVRFEQGEWTVYDSQSGMPGNSVQSLIRTSSEKGTSTILVGTTAGLARLEPRLWTAFDTSSNSAAANGQGNHVQCLLETRNADGTSKLWVGTQGGLACFERGRWKTYDTNSGLPGNSVTSLVESVGRDGTRALWVGTQGGLARFERGTWTVFDDESSELPDNQIWTILETRTDDGASTLWVGTQGGLARFERGIWTAYDTIPAVRATDSGGGLLDYAAKCLLETRADDGTRTLWVGTTAGLARLERDTWTVYDTSSGLRGNTVLCLMQAASEDGTRTLWAGTLGGGVARLKLSDGQPVWATLPDESAASLLDSTVRSMCQDRHGRIYLGTNKGVVRLTPRVPTSGDPSEFSIQTFTTENGLPSNACSDMASIVDSRDRIWIGTVAGAAMLDPSRESVDLARKPLYVELALARDAEGNEKPLSQDVSLDYDEGNLEFECALLSYFREKDTRYRTQLVGNDRVPSNWTNEYRRVYTNLREGDYTFQVWATDSSGNVSGPVAISFAVRAAPWRTWWAYFLYAVMFGGLAVGGAQWRTRSVSRRNELLEATIAAQTAELARRVDQLEVSERQAHESEASANRANRAKSVFLSNMSHELRTPLNAVLGYSQLMARDANRSEPDREKLATIQRSGEYLLGLINDVLSIARIESGKLALAEQTFDLHLLVRGLDEMIRVRAEAKGLQLAVDVTPGVPRAVRGDAGKLQQVLANLLGNAVKFTDAGTVTLRTMWADGRAGFEVRDTGPGIAEDEIGQLFEPFVQAESGRRAAEGAGLGLAISRNLAALMGGDIRVISQVGHGTTFRLDVDLPSADETAVPVERRRVIRLVESDAGQPAFRILVADDMAENRALLRALLGSVGFKVREAADGKQAFETWAAWQPHLIWMDQRMPVMDGHAATQAIRAAEAREVDPSSPLSEPFAVRRCRIIALTAGAFEHERELILASGCDDLVTKPFREETIFDTVAEHLGVRYVYENSEIAAQPRPEEPALTPARLAALPAAWIAALARAVRIGDDVAALRVAERIAERDEPVAGELRRRIRNLQFDVIIGLLEGTPP